MSERDGTPEGAIGANNEKRALESRIFGEQTGIYPISGEDLVEWVRDSEFKELSPAVMESLSFSEGLVFGPEVGKVYDLDDERVSIYLLNLFTTTEGAMYRPDALYLGTTISNLTEGRVRNADRFDRYPDGWIKRRRKKLKRAGLDEGLIDEKINIEKEELSEALGHAAEFIELKNSRDARAIIDGAFIQRMGTCEDPSQAANLLTQDRRYRPPMTPDKGHWKTFFGSYKDKEKTNADIKKFGEKVDKTLRAIVEAGLPLEGKAVTRYGKELVNGEEKDINEVRVEGAGIPNAIYAKGFEDTQEFKKWLKYLLEVSGGRLDVVWAAWRLALIWELPAQLGKAIEYGVEEVTDQEGNKSKKETKDVTLALPPVGTAIGPWFMQLEDKQRIEWGLDAEGKRLVVDRNLSHTGHPLNFLGPQEFVKMMMNDHKSFRGVWPDSKRLGEVLRNEPEKLEKFLDGNTQVIREVLTRMASRRNPCESFLHESKVKIPNPKGSGKRIRVSLWEIWQGNPKKGIKPTSFADSEFPWASTEEVRKEDAGELPSGTFGSWLLRRLRAFSVVKDIRSRPPRKELEEGEFFSDRVRTWNKIFGKVKKVEKGQKGYIEPWENPRTWWAAGLIHAYYPGPAKQLVKSSEDELDYRGTTREEFAQVAREGTSDRPAVKDILQNALKGGFLRKVDYDWIARNIGG